MSFPSEILASQQRSLFNLQFQIGLYVNLSRENYARKRQLTIIVKDIIYEVRLFHLAVIKVKIAVMSFIYYYYEFDFAFFISRPKYLAQHRPIARQIDGLIKFYQFEDIAKNDIQTLFP